MVRHHRITGLLLAAAICLGFTRAAEATRVDLNVFENDTGADTSFLDLWVDVTSNGSGFDFTFHNDSTDDAVMTTVYFEDGLGAVLDGNSASITTETNVDFSLGGSPGDPPGGPNVGWLNGNTLNLASANPAPPHNGIKAGGTNLLTVNFDGVGGATLDDVLNLLGSNGRIAAHVQALAGPNDASVSVISDGPVGTVIPLPPAAWLGLAMLGGMGVVRRYNRCAA